jgi:hypothetical protein
MTDKSKWFVYKLEDGGAFGCFRIKPFDDSKLQIATHAIQDWENVALQQKGEEEPEHETRYTPQNAYDLLMNSAIGLQLFNWIVEKSKSIK